MKSVLFCLVGLIQIAIAAYGQSPGDAAPPVVSQDVLTFFDHVFLCIANLEDTASDLQERQEAFTVSFDLSEEEKAALGSAVHDYQVGLAPLRDAAAQTPADQSSSLDALALQRLGLVQRVTSVFFGSVSARCVNRLIMEAQRSAQLLKPGQS
jgi:hypothetical protein